MLLIVFYSEFTNSLDHLLMKKLLYILLSICLFYACSKKESDSSEILKDSIVISSNDKLVLEQKSCSAEIIFTSSGEWSARIDPNAATWCNIDKLQGLAGENTIIVSVSENTSYDERNASITLLSGKVKQFITITQKQKDALIVSSNKVELNAEGGKFSIEAQSNIGISYEIDENVKSWLHADVSRGLATSTLAFTADANESLERREGNIYINGDNGQTETVTVYQAGEEPSILLSQKEYTVSSDGATIQVELKSNTSYKVLMPEVSWITEFSTRKLHSYTHYFKVSKNENYQDRMVEIYFVNEENGLQEKINVTQVQKDTIVIAEDEYTMNATGGILEFTVNANVDFKIDIDADWIRQIVKARGLTAHTLIFEVSENISVELRKAKIELKSDDCNQLITVVQQGNNLTDGNIDDMPIIPW